MFISRYFIFILFLISLARAFAIEVQKIDPSRVIQRPTILDREVQFPKSVKADKYKYKSLPKKVTLKKVTIMNKKQGLNDQIDNILKKYMWREISLEGLSKLVNEITAIYRNAGYIFSRAVLPKQNIKDGTVVIHIIHSKINQYEFTGDEVGYFNKKILTAMGDNIVREDKQQEFSQFERYAKVANDIDGLDTKFILIPSKSGKENKLDINIERKPIDITAGVDNESTESLGLNRLFTNIRVNNAWLGGSLSGMYMVSPDLKN
jgi:hemolysin activation/secretion protein